MEYRTQNDDSGAKRVSGTFVVHVNEKGRMTLPAKVRQLLHLSTEPSMVEMVVQADGRIAIQGKLPTVAEMAGSVKPLEPSMDWKEMEAIAREEITNRYHEKFK